MTEGFDIKIEGRPRSLLVKVSYVFCVVASLWVVLFAVLFLANDPSTQVYSSSKDSALSGLKGALFMGGLAFLLDKKDEIEWLKATPFERKATYLTRKKKKNAKNK